MGVVRWTDCARRVWSDGRIVLGGCGQVDRLYQVGVVRCSDKHAPLGGCGSDKHDPLGGCGLEHTQHTYTTYKDTETKSYHHSILNITTGQIHPGRGEKHTIQ